MESPTLGAAPLIPGWSSISCNPSARKFRPCLFPGWICPGLSVVDAPPDLLLLDHSPEQPPKPAEPLEPIPAPVLPGHSRKTSCVRLSQVSPVCHPAMSPRWGSGQSSPLPRCCRAHPQPRGSNWCCWDLFSYWGYWCVCVGVGPLSQPCPCAPRDPPHVQGWNPALRSRLFSKKSPVAALAQPFSPLEKQMICICTTYHEFGATRSPGLPARKDPR